MAGAVANAAANRPNNLRRSLLPSPCFPASPQDARFGSPWRPAGGAMPTTAVLVGRCRFELARRSGYIPSGIECMNRTGLLIALAVAVVVGLVFGIWPDLDLDLAALFFDADRGGFWRAFDPTYGWV